MSRDMRFQTIWYVRPAAAQISLGICLCWSLEYSMTAKLLTEHHLEFLSLKGGCTGLSESTLVKMPYCWKSHVTAHICTFQHFRLVGRVGGGGGAKANRAKANSANPDQTTPRSSLIWAFTVFCSE